jgi:hypothetical protein
MYISALYISSSSFSVSGDHQGSYKPSMRVNLYQSDGQAGTTVQTVAYDVSSDKTIITVSPSVCLPQLTRVGLGDTFADPDTETGNIGEHGHTAPWSAGYIPAASFTDEEIIALRVLIAPTM